MIFKSNNKNLIGEELERNLFEVRKKIEKQSNLLQIKDFYIGKEKYNFVYKSRPHKHYDWISKWEDFGEGMYFLLENNKKHKIDRKEYIKIMKKIGRNVNLKHLNNYNLLHKRLY